MTATAAIAVPPATRTRTGGPGEGPDLLEHALGWVLVVVLAMLVSGLGLL
ncbi:SCO1431 family membrane protein [Streptomyces sp. NPDC047968]